MNSDEMHVIGIHWHGFVKVLITHDDVHGRDWLCDLCGFEVDSSPVFSHQPMTQGGSSSSFTAREGLRKEQAPKALRRSRQE